ncbi:SDR family oxidoreductase [Rhodococcus sp. NPDC058514]|uniref:SDR family oxidoreductase n=1 Tax=unclassified Rhodococcus (in: high G+C Gram-positive bacteria) TaxID=192944 RepID=UPI003649E12E
MKPNAMAGRVVAVTGGAQGIGREIARQLTVAGARVAIGDVDGVGARATAKELGDNALGLDLDVTDTGSFTKFLEAVKEHWGPLDVLVNNAGVMWVGGFEEEPEAATRRQLDINLHGVIRGVKLAAPAMRDRGRGHIVTIASAASKLSPAGEATYAATKHGVFGYLEAVRAELYRSGIELSVVMPGVVDTELAVGTAHGAAALLTPADVAKAVVAVIERPKFEVPVPGFIGPLERWVNVFPQPIRDFLHRKMVPNQITSANRSVRAGYESRAVSDDNTGETP